MLEKFTQELKGVRKNGWAGLLLCLSLAIIATFLSAYIPLLGSVSLVIILGMLVGNFTPGKDVLNPGISFSEKRILPLAIALLGTSLQLDVLFSLGLPALLLVVSLVFVTIMTARYLGKLFGFSRSFSLVMGTGNAICGSSAIAAVCHTLNASEEETGISVGVVNFMGVIGLFLMPMILFPLSISPDDKAMLIGGSLQAVGQVVAAGYSLGNEIGAAAVLIKMGRVLLLGPVAMIFVLLANGKTKGKNKSAVKFPYFILGFFLFSFLSSYNYLPAEIVSFLKSSGKFLLVISMAAIGYKIQLSSLKNQGIKVLVFGFLLAIIQVGFIAAWLWLA